MGVAAPVRLEGAHVCDRLQVRRLPDLRPGGGVTPDPVVVWTSEGAAKSFIDSKGGADEFQPVAVDDGSLDAIAKAMGCPVEQITLEPYPS